MTRLSFCPRSAEVCNSAVCVLQYDRLLRYHSILYHWVMNTSIYVHLLPQLCSSNDFEGNTAVVIDILRATTTITHALGNGAEAVHPTQEVDEALKLAKQFPPEEVILGGERHGEIIEDFDFGNSPFSYNPDVVSNKQIIFTTTNGTRAMAHCHQASTIYLGAFSCISALADQLIVDSQTKPVPIHLVCAGTDGKVTHEDVLFAGALISQLCEASAEFEIANDEAKLALDSYLVRTNSTNGLHSAISASQGGVNLLRLKYEHDIKRAAERDLYKIVPKYDLESGKITAWADNIQHTV